MTTGLHHFINIANMIWDSSLIVFLLLISMGLLVGSDLFSSIAKLEPVVETEKELIQSIHKYLHLEKERLQNIERFVMFSK